MDYIYLRQYRPGDSISVQPWETDFIRRRQLIRVNVFHPLNTPISSIEAPAPFDDLLPGIHGWILHLAVQQKIPLLDPADPSITIEYSDIAEQLLAWQGMQTSTDQSVAGSQLGLEWLQPSLDLITDQHFSTDLSRSGYRIQFLRLIWYHPHLSLGPRAVAFIPYISVRPFFETVTCGAGLQSPEGITLATFLEKGYVFGQPLRLEEDPVIVLPSSQYNSTEPIQINWEH